MNNVKSEVWWHLKKSLEDLLSEQVVEEIDYLVWKSIYYQTSNKIWNEVVRCLLLGVVK